jgi:uncharacterized protein YdiU (UPF0061 family)
MTTTAATPGSLEALPLWEGYAALGPGFVQRLDPTPLPRPQLVAFSPGVAGQLGLDPAQASREAFVRLAAGCARFRPVQPFAAVYAGHQFGTYVPQLGDGRAITLGEVRADGGSLEWQLKGAGQTAFSRFGDGRAVLRSTIREYLASEAMAALGIPTTRALALAIGDEPVYRETVEGAAVLSRVAPSHLRFGHFEFFHYARHFEHVKVLADYAIARFFTPLGEIGDEPARYAALFREVCERTARLIAQWQAVGFAHGVMNTDNMSLLGLTLDYGPYGFLDAYVPQFVCNHSDELGRYAFDRQPSIARWNLRALGEALSTLLDADAVASGLGAFDETFETSILARMREKFGLAETERDDEELIETGLALFEANGVDYTRTFRLLSRFADGAQADTELAPTFVDRAAWTAWRGRYLARLSRETRPATERHAAMLRVNPAYVLRNYLAQEAIAAAEARDYGPLLRLEAALRTPFDETPENERYAAAPLPGSEAIVVSCSS